MCTLFGHLLLSCLLSGGRGDDTQTATQARCHDTCFGVLAVANPADRSADLPANQPSLFSGKGERDAGADERPRLRPRRDFGNCRLASVQPGLALAPPPPLVLASMVILARGIRLQI